MGLLDSLMSGSQGGYGGLLDMLMYRSPLNQPAEALPQNQYDPMGNFTGITSQPAPSPFGPVPGFDPSIYAPSSPFTSGSAPVSGLQGGLPALPSQSVAPAPQVTPTIDAPQNPISVGGYQMPRIGNSTDFNPQMPTDVSARSRQAPVAPAVAPPEEPGASDRFIAGLQNFANAGGILPAIADGISGLVTGRRTDAAGMKQQNQRAQFEALSPLLGPQKAMLAVMNPEAGKILLEQALSNKQKFTEIGVNDNGAKQYGFVNDRDQTVRPYNAPNSTSGPVTMQGPDGSMITMPQGADPKTWKNEITKINADVAAGKKTEVQAKSEKFGNKMETAEKNLSGLQGQGASLFGQIASNVPLGNYVQSEAYQKYNQAKNNFITALLRDESGAAIGTQEFQRYERELFPQPGDSPAVIQQKAQARQTAIDGMKKSAGPGYKSPTASSGLPSGWSVSIR